ncbi:alpha-L-fucosidase [Companilactobacillus baiquanensis]|uniref:alpha-L-fucosidase n=1 Tax=Companilactobacillus baiquanensis TaxID=2486005 RepID=A0ABW1UXF1_9LACO|nr:alpha-L-fucosidase [Companilactobacillus baiquanensis]
MNVPLKRIKNYEDLGLGLFIHWGLYSQLEQGEWTEFIHGIDKTKYEKLADTFTAKNFDAEKIVKQAKNMGAKYIVLTSKHHEGFFLYDSKGLSNFDAVHSAAKRDLIKEFVDTCNKYDIKPFLYMATYDWHNPLYETDFNKYLEYLRKSVEILSKNYGPIGGFWFDGNWNKKDADWKLDELYGTIRKYQPEAMIINNTGLKNRGKIINPEIDAVTYERGTPDSINHGDADQKYVAGEMSLTLNQHWGYAKADINFKSPREIIENICHARNIGANILVNIGLTGTGSIPTISKEYMKMIGLWMQNNGQAIYKARPTEIKPGDGLKDFALFDGKNLYLFIFNLKIVGNSNVVLGGEGINPRSFTGISHNIKNISWLDNQEELSFIQNNDMLTINATGFKYGTDLIVRVAKVEF